MHWKKTFKNMCACREKNKHAAVNLMFGASLAVNNNSSSFPVSQSSNLKVMKNYHCNPLKKFSFLSDSLKFEVKRRSQADKTYPRFHIKVEDCNNITATRLCCSCDMPPSTYQSSTPGSSIIMNRGQKSLVCDGALWSNSS